MEISNKKLSIRNKIIYIIVFCSIFFIILFYFISSTFLLRAFSNLENAQVIRNLDRAEISFSNIIENQSIKLKDWAYWDDTYHFIEDKNNAYIESNLTNESLVSLGLNLIVFINTKDEIVFAKFVDIESGKDLSQDKVLDYIKTNLPQIKAITEKNKTNNIIKLPEGEMILSVDRILKSDQSGPSKGTIIFGSYVNDKIVEKISGVVGFPTFFYPYNSYSDKSDIILAKNNLKSTSDHYIHIMRSMNIVHGYSYIDDIFDNHAYLIRVELPRDIYNSGRNMVSILIIIIFFTIILLDILITILLEKFLIKRLIKLEEDVSNIGLNGDFSKKLEEDRNDEIGGLSISINLMLDKVVEANIKEKELDEEQKIMNINMKSHAEEVDKLNKLMIGRELKMIELKKENLKLKGE